MRITTKVHAHCMPVVDFRKIKGVANDARKSGDSI